MNDMIGDDIDKQDDLRGGKVVRGGWLAWIVKHMILVAISVIASLIAMVRVKHGWSLEPLLWLAAVWYIPLLLIVDFAILRAQGRLGTLLAITTATALIIMFPFSEIQKAHGRVRMTGLQGKVKYVQPTTYWNWWEIAPGKLIPNGLAWRVPLEGLPSRSRLMARVDETFDVKSIPYWLRSELSDMTIIVEHEARSSRNRLTAKPNSSERLQPVSLEVRAADKPPDSPQRPNGDWILEQVDCSLLNSLSISGVDFSERVWDQLLSNSSLRYICLRDTNGSRNLFRENVTYNRLLRLELKRVETVNAARVTEMLSRSKLAEQVFISEGLACDPLLPFLLNRQNDFWNVISIDYDATHRRPIDHSFDFSKKSLRFIGFKDSGFDWVVSHPAAHKPSFIEFIRCEFSAEALLQAIQLTKNIESCRITLSEYKRLQKLLSNGDGADSLRRKSWLQDVQTLIAARRLTIIVDANPLESQTNE